MNDDILLQIVEGLWYSPQFFLQFGESAHVSSCPQLLVYARYISGSNLHEQYLFL